MRTLPAGDVDTAVPVEGNHVGQSLVPTLLVHEWLAQLVFTRVGMHPPILSRNPDLGRSGTTRS